MTAARSQPESSDALDAWVLATLPRAVAYAASLIRDRAAAEDVVHDCYFRILKKADVYDIPRDGTKILYRAITNAAINRTNARRLVSLDALGDEDRGFMDRRTSGPLDHLIAGELGERVALALSQLSVPQRAAVELKSLGHSLQEIADALETTVTNAGVLIHRARTAIARCLTGREHEVS